MISTVKHVPSVEVRHNEVNDQGPYYQHRAQPQTQAEPPSVAMETTGDLRIKMVTSYRLNKDDYHR